jgi:hypothetical protein
MGLMDSKSYQLRVRVTAEERDLLEKLRTARKSGETISDLVREAISILTKGGTVGGNSVPLTPAVQSRVERLADLLKREPHQVEEACIEGILDMIEGKCEVPLIVMETHLHQKYRSRGATEETPGDLPASDSPPAA